VPTGHFVECYTQQRGALPSVRVIALGKEQRPGHRFRDFAECNVAGTRQRGTLCRVPHIALGKEHDMGALPGGFFAECPWWHSAKIDSLPSAAGQTLGKGNSLAECLPGHSAKTPSSSPVVVTAAFLCRVLPGTRQTSLPSAREKALGKEGFADALCRAFFAECDTRQSLCRVFLRLCRVLRALGKAHVSGSVYIISLQQTQTIYLVWLVVIMASQVWLVRKLIWRAGYLGELDD
jgi:hypothetical protein